METTAAITKRSSFYIPPRVMEIALSVRSNVYVKNNPTNRSVIWQTLDHTLRSRGIALPYFQLKELGDLLSESD
jgi:hypothetical protein